MKRVLLFITLVLSLSLSLAALPREPLSARAEGERYAVADSREVWFYADEIEGTGLFILPYTYYVKVLSEGDVFCAVEYLYDSQPYKKIRGYCKKSALRFVDFVPVRPYLLREITLSYTLPNDYANLGNGNFGSIERSFVYYGHRYELGKLYFYVAQNGVFDYVPADEELTYDLNTDYLPPPEQPASGESAGGLSAVQVVVICLVCAATVVVAVFVLRGKRPAHDAQEASDF